MSTQAVQTVAFFDLDRTLIAANSGVLYAKWERRHGRISRRQMAQSLVWGALYHFDLIDLDKAFQVALNHYRGMPEAELRERTQAWFAEDVAHRVRPGSAAVLKRHRHQGDPCVLLTNSSSYAAEAATEALKLDDWLANRFETDEQGALTGGYERPLCYGQGKVLRAQEWLEARGGSLAQSWFYTDALSDLPMLEAVGHPVVVHPDPRLRRIAKRRGWRVEMW